MLTRQAQGKENGQTWPEGVLAFNSLEAALQALSQPELADQVERVFVIGGAQVLLSCSSCVQLPQQRPSRL